MSNYSARQAIAKDIKGCMPVTMNCALPPDQQRAKHLAVGAQHLNQLDPLPESFYARAVTEVARALLGCDIVRQVGSYLLRARIVETEAYAGFDDLASHAARGLTKRNSPMFGPPGRLYVYLIYGIHHCMNVVAEAEHSPAAVLIRAAEPICGHELMSANRGGRESLECTSGPGKLCEALAIDRRFNHHAIIRKGPLYISAGTTPKTGDIASGPRVGVTGDADAKTRPWRFFLVHSPYVSRRTRHS